MRDAEKTVGNIVDKQSVSFVGSIDANGFPNMKAMLQPRRREGIRTFYFTTNTSSMRVAQYRNNHHACIYFYDKRFFVKDIIGRSLVIHSMADDFTSQPSGNSGSKIGCGIIQSVVN